MPNIKSDIAKLRNTGTNLIAAGKLVEARKLFARVCELNDLDYDAHIALGIINGMLGDASVAIQNLERAIEICPDHPDAYYNLGIALKNMGDLEGAAVSYQKAISLAPDNAACHNNLGSILLYLRDFDNSIQCFNKALELSPDSAEYYYNLGNALKRKGLRSAACKALNTALRLHPGLIPALKVLGTVYISLANLEGAERCFSQIIEDNPNDEDAISGMASILIYRKDYGNALALLEPYLDRHSVSPSIALAFSNISKHIGKSSDAIKLLEKVLGKNENLNNESKAQIHFNLGYFYDNNEKYKLAFEHFRMGNKLRISAHVSDDYGNITNNIITSLNRDYLCRTAHSDNATELPVFIVGMPRSGTSLVEQIIAAHPCVYGAGELDTLPTLLNSIPDLVGTENIFPDGVARLDKTILNDISQKYLEYIKSLDSDALRITDKMPDNFTNLGFIELLFPKARIIHCKRNPLDTCLSCYFQDFDGHQYATSLKALGQFYLQYHRLMQHWKKVLSIRLLEVDYEELINSFDISCNKIIDFCGLEWNKTCLSFYSQDRVVVTASQNQVNKPIYTKSINRWKNYEAYIGELKSALSRTALNRIIE